MANFYNPTTLKLIDGIFAYGHVVTLQVDDVQIKRKVGYDPIDGLYIAIMNTRYGKADFERMINNGDI